MNPLQRSHLDFVTDLHRALARTGDDPADATGDIGTAADGLVWSPYSVASALGLAAAGARGQTRDELATVLAPGSDLTAQGRMLADSAQVADAEAAVANTLWMRTGLPFDDGYRQAVLDWPGGALHTADFAGDPEAVRRSINADVDKTTRGLVKELLSPGHIHPDLTAVIVNALYLKVAWRIPFDVHETAPSPFYAPSGTRQVPTMRQTERMPYAAADGWRMVTLPTAGALAVDVLLPESPTAPAGDAATVGMPAAGTLARLREATAGTKIELSLPRFRIESHAVLNSALHRLGVTTAFSRAADFSGITRAERVWIDQVVHKAVLDVDEAGFEGAAATAIMMRMVSLDLGQPVEFRVNRPFLLLVRHAGSDAVFFSASVTEP